jgi:hypothetical protein
LLVAQGPGLIPLWRLRCSFGGLRVCPGLSDNNGEVEFVTAAEGHFVYRMAGGFVRGIGLEIPTNLEGFGQTARSSLAIGASVAVDVEEPEIPADYELCTRPGCLGNQPRLGQSSSGLTSV